MTLKIKFMIYAYASSFFFSTVLFISAGRIDYFQGWIYLLINFISTLMNVLTIQSNPELMSERTKPGEGTKSWDKLILGSSFLVFVSTIVLAGLDSGRYRWSPQLHWSIYALGILLMISGQIIFLLARSENRLFSTVVRIQRERGQTVCDSGLYGVIRHRGYSGMMISTIGLPFVLGSIWSAVPSFVSMILLCMRTFLEDKTLENELDGYVEYTKKTPYKLIPWIW
jgi:protein-S-isoprenylcysteine O-methyltransferase Ste14